jgi:uncharacterized protein (TIGR03437 family)
VAFPVVVCAQVDVLTANYDNTRTNANRGEFVLNKNNVNPKQFGNLYSFQVDGEVYAQPLYVHGLKLPDGSVRNVLFVATMHNSVYAFDADASQGTSPLWSQNLGPSVNSHDFDLPPNPSASPPFQGLPYTDILNEIGILSTPVIDPVSATLYAVYYTYQGTGDARTYAYFLDALDLATGAEKLGAPVQIKATSIGSGWAGLETPVDNQIPFDATQHLQRPGLLLLNGKIYIAFGSHGDEAPWHGWLMAYDATTLQQAGALNTTPDNAAGSSIWQGGRGLAADPEGNIYCTTGNGSWDGVSSWGQSVLRIDSDMGLAVADSFTPSDWSPLNLYDTDFGSTGPVLISGTNLLYAIGKQGQLFLLDKTDLGQESSSDNQVVQSFQAAKPGTLPSQLENSFLVFNSAFWNNSGGGILYLWPAGLPLRSYRMRNYLFDTTPYSTNISINNHQPFSGMSVSAYGSESSTGILWATSVNSGKLPAPATLHAFDALDVSRELWNSDMNGFRDALGNFTKFVTPTVANGKVFAPSGSHQIVVYGLLPGVPSINSVLNGAGFGFGAVAPGELITIFGNSLGPAEATAAAAVDGHLPNTLAGVQVTFNGTPAPLLYGAAGQINAIVPFEVAGQSTVNLAIASSTGGALNVSLPVSAASPAIFSENASGAGQGAILNQDSTRNSAANPAVRGSIVAFYATGTGATKPSSPDGVLTPLLNPPVLAQSVTVTIGGQNAPVTYQGAAPGLVAGVSQINAQVPLNIAAGTAVPVTITVGGVKSGNTVTLAVK